MEDRAARLAANEAVFRAGNEAIDANATAAGTEGKRVYMCECGTRTCLEQVPLTAEEYQAVRSEPARFFVVPGHEDQSAGEVVVDRSNRYVVVEKQGSPRQIAEETDPRANPDEFSQR
jgi:hypothetical protein